MSNEKIFSTKDVEKIISTGLHESHEETARLIKDFVEQQINKEKIKFYESQIAKLTMTLTERVKQDKIFGAKIDSQNQAIANLNGVVDLMNEALKTRPAEIIDLASTKRQLEGLRKSLRNQTNTLERLSAILMKVVNKAFPTYVS